MRMTSFVLCLLLLGGCSGLPYPREMGDMALLRVMGVDWTPEGLQVTVSTGRRAEHAQSGQRDALTLSALRPSLSGAVLEIQGKAGDFIFFGYVDQLLLGEELARQGIIPVLDYFARDVELGLGARLWMSRQGTAAAAVESGDGQGIDRRLETLQADGEMGIAVISRTAGEVYSDLLERGSAYIPALELPSQEGEALHQSGYAVLKANDLMGYLDGEQARGLELLEGRPMADVVELTLAGGERAVVKVTGAVTLCRLRPEGAGLSLLCRVEGAVVECDRRLTAQEREWVEAALGERELTRIKGTLELLRLWQTDCVGLGMRAGVTAPREWSRVEGEWPVQFSKQEPEVIVKVELHQI